MKPYVIKGETFDFQKEPVVMGILNVTPDSFSDGGKYNEVTKAVEHAREMLEAGAQIIDVGGESTRPGHASVSEEEEIRRVVPIIEALTKELDCVISIDTYKAKVAEAAVRAGASIINDVWGAQKETAIAEVAARFDIPIILMHNREEANYPEGFIVGYEADLKRSITIAKEAGVREENIWLDR